MDTASVLAVVGSAIAIIGVVISMMFWTRSEANELRRDIFNLVKAIENEVKDFHSRLIEIERGRK